MRVADRLVRLLIVLALTLAAPALTRAPAQAAAGTPHHAALATHAHDGAVAAMPECDHPAPAPAAHHLTPDCLICCCALSTPLVAPQVSRAAVRVAPSERVAAFDSLNRPPPAPPPRG